MPSDATADGLRPMRIAIVNDYEVVVVGLAGILGRFGDRVEIVELDSRMPVGADVDLVLYDSFGQAQGAALDLESITGGSAARVVVYSWNVQPEIIDQSFAQGAAGYISKAVNGEDLVALLEKVRGGGRVRPQTDQDIEGSVGAWPGREHGITPREAEVLALICQGLSNQDICDRAFISQNTLKSYIRSLYTKIGVESRTQAVLWGIDHGFRPDRSRHTHPGEF